MSNYSPSTDFAGKDQMPAGAALKVIRGVEFTTEFTDIATAILSKADIESPTFTGTVVIPNMTLTGTLSTGTIDGGVY